ncbi:sensor histidine kinase [Paenibacillus macerans]|uniref:sensor histidine kinase n=1 Tax=Paenibacillus macerans TaxID=44252 RepID=UPI003D315AD9
MEPWSVGNKMIVLGLMVALAYFSAAAPSSWLVLFILVYLALNLSAMNIRKPGFRLAVHGLTVVYASLCAVYVSPEFALLLPLSICELACSGPVRQMVPAAALIVPAVFLHGTLLIIYAFIALISLFNSLLVQRLIRRMNQQEGQLDKMREDQEKLRKQLHENREFIRASEYTYKLEERNRLSQEIHDGVGHSMTGALIQMEAAKRLLHHDPPGAEKLLQNAIGIAKEAIEQIRQTLKNMKPPVQQLGIHRLRTAVEAFGGQSGLHTTVVHGGDLERITPLHWKIIHDNVTEALTNTAKYAEATAVHVEVRVLSKLIKVMVSDNGRGQAKIVKGLGLLGMEERTAAVHGTVIADGANGFTVTMLIPFGGK